MDNFEVFNGKAAYPAYTTKELKDAIAANKDTMGKMTAEVARRAKVAAGDMSAATGAERLKFANRV